MRHHNLRIQHLGIPVNKRIGRLGAWRLLHEMPDGHNPRARQGFMIFRNINVIMLEKSLQGLAHHPASGFSIVFRQINVSQPQMRAMVEVRRQNLAGLEVNLKIPVFF